MKGHLQENPSNWPPKDPKPGNVPWNQTPGSVIPPPHVYFLDWYNRKGANAIGMIIPSPATTESGDGERSSKSQPYKAHFFYGARGYKAARGLISWEITRNPPIYTICQLVLWIGNEVFLDKSWFMAENCISSIKHFFYIKKWQIFVYCLVHDICFWLRFGLANAINNYLRLKNRIVCVGNF